MCHEGSPGGESDPTKLRVLCMFNRKHFSVPSHVTTKPGNWVWRIAAFKYLLTDQVFFKRSYKKPDDFDGVLLRGSTTWAPDSITIGIENGWLIPEE